MQKPHVFIIDDDHIARTGIAFMLKNLGYETSEAFNGIRALEILKSEKNPKVDAIILDRMMPEMSGIEVLQKIHAIPSLAHIPVIMLTVQAERNHIKKAMAYGAFDVLFKPIDELTLDKTLESALNRDRT